MGHSGDRTLVGWSDGAERLPQVGVAVAAAADCQQLHLLSAEQDLVSPTVQHVGGRHVAECLVIVAEVVVVDVTLSCPPEEPAQLRGQ